MPRTLARATLMTVLFLASACAFGNRHARLVYPPSDEGEVKVTAPTGAQIALLPVKDSRADKKVIGIVRNGFHMHTASAVTDDDGEAWLTKGLQVELTRAGMSVVPAKPGVALLGTDMTQMVCDAYMHYNGDVSIHAWIEEDGKRTFDQVYALEGEQLGMNWAASEDSFTLCVSHALQLVLRRLANDVSSKVKAAPSSATPGA